MVSNLLIASTANAKEMMASISLCSLGAQAVAQLAEGNEQNGTAFAEAGAIQPLMVMLSSPDARMQATAAGALSGICRGHTGNQAAIGRTGAMAPLCALIKEGTSEVQEQCAAALWSLSADCAPNKATIAKLGGIEPLVVLLVSGGTPTSLDVSVGALASLASRHPDNREAIAKHIVSRLSSRMAMVGVGDGAVRVLRSISLLCVDSPQTQVAIAKAGGVPPLIMWLSGGFDARSFNADAQQEAARALLALVESNTPLQAFVAKSDGILPLVELLSSKSALTTRECAARALWHLAGDSTLGLNIAENGGIAPLAAMLTVDDTHLQELSAVVICRLLRSHVTVAATLASVGGILPLVRLLEAGSPTAQQQAAAAIAEATLAPDHRDEVAKAGAIAALVQLLSSREMGTSEVAARALAHLSQDGELGEDTDEADAPDAAITPPTTPAPAPLDKENTQIGRRSSMAPPMVEQRRSGTTSPTEATRHRRPSEARQHRPSLTEGMPPDELSVEVPSASAGALRRQLICDANGVASLVAMLQTPSHSNTSKRMADLMANVLSLDGNSLDRIPNGTMQEVIGMQEQAAATLTEMAFRDATMQDTILAAGAVPPLLQLLRNGSQLARENACRLLWRLCADLHNQGTLVDCGAISELVTLSKVGSPKAQELAAAVISDLAKGAIAEREQQETNKPLVPQSPGDGLAVPPPEQPSPEDEGEGKAPPAPKDRLSAIAEAGGILPLVGLVTSGNPASKERAASALWHLSLDPVNQQAVARAGGIAPLVMLLEDGNRQATRFAADALARLAQDNEDNQALMAKKLVGLLGSSNEAAQRRSAHMLRELVHKHDGAPQRVVNAGAISPLVALLGTGELETKEEAAGALHLLAVNRSNQLAIAIGLVALLGTGSEDSQEHVTAMLERFVEDRENCVAISEAGAIERLVIQLESDSMALHERTTAVLTALVEDSNDHVDSLVLHGGISPLVRLLDSASQVAMERASRIFAAMARSSHGTQAQVATAQAIASLVNLVANAELRLPVRSEAAGALWWMSNGNAEKQAAIVTAGALVPLVQLLQTNSADAQRLAAGALASLAVGSNETRTSIATAGGITPLVSLLNADASRHEVHAAAAWALAEVSRDHPENQSAVAAAGSVEPLIALLIDADEMEAAKEAAATALWSLSTSHRANQDAIAASGGVEPLVKLIGIGSASAQVQAAGSLSAIALDNPSNESAISTLVVELLRGGDNEASTKAARAISSLARACATNQVALARAGAIAPIVSLLKAESEMPAPSAMLQREMAAALWSMAQDDPDNQMSIADEGAIPSLVSLLSEKRGKGRASGEGTPAAAPSPAGKRGKGAAWSGSPMPADDPTERTSTPASASFRSKTTAGSGWAEVRRDAAGALWALSQQQELIAAHGGVPPLVSLLRNGTAEAKVAAAGAVCSLAAYRPIAVELFDCGGVPALAALVESGTEEARTQAADALTLMVVENSVNQSAVAHALVGILDIGREPPATPEAHAHVTRLLLTLSREPANRGALSNAGAVKQLAHQLRNSLPETMESATAALSEIALKSTNHRVMVTQELTILFSDREEEVRKRAGDALKDMAAKGGSGTQMTVAMAGGIDRFVSLLKEGSLEAQEYALWLLQQSPDNASKVSIATARCVRPIINVLRAGRLSVVAQEHGAALLASLSSAVPGVGQQLLESNQAEMFRTGGIRPLVGLLATGSAHAKRHAAMTLAHLARSPIYLGAPAPSSAPAPAGLDSGGAPTQSRPTSDSSIARASLWAHVRAAVDQDAEVSSPQRAIVAAGAVDALVAWLVDSTCGPADLGARALSDIAAQCVDAQQAVLESGAVPPLVEMTALPTALPTARTAASGAFKGEETDWPRWAAAALAALAQDNAQCQIAIAEEVGGLSHLVEMLRRPCSGPARENAMRALRHLAMNADNKVELANLGAMPALVNVLEDDTAGEDAHEAAAAALEAMTLECVDNQLALLRVGAITPLVALLGSEHEESQVHASGALLHAAAPLTELSRVSVVRPLVALLDVRNASAQMKAAELLAILAARSTAHRTTVARASAIPSLVRLLGDGRNVKTTQVHSAAALCELARAAENRELVVSAGGVEPLVGMLTSASVEAQSRACAAVFHLSPLTSTQQRVVGAGGILPLVKLLASGHLEAARGAAGTLWHVAAHAENKVAIVKAGAIVPLVTLLARTDSPEAQEAAAGVLAALAKEKGAAKRAICNTGGLAPLIELLSAGTPTAQKHAACALWGITLDVHFRDAVTRAGAVQPLMKLGAPSRSSLHPHSWRCPIPTDLPLVSLGDTRGRYTDS